MWPLMMVIAVSFTVLSCEKENSEGPIYIGEVIQQRNDCTGSTGFPFIIKYSQGNEIDSLITLTLPTEFKLIGTRITIQMRNLNSTDEIIPCNSLSTHPNQKIIFNVKYNKK